MALKRSQATTRELHRVAPSLEQLFVQVVTEAEKPAAAEREQRRPKDWRATTALKES
jgi:hypothetical protein